MKTDNIDRTRELESIDSVITQIDNVRSMINLNTHDDSRYGVAIKRAEIARREHEEGNYFGAKTWLLRVRATMAPSRFNASCFSNDLPSAYAVLMRKIGDAAESIVSK